MALNKVVYRRMSNGYLKQKAFVLDIGSLGETPMTSFYTWHKHV